MSINSINFQKGKVIAAKDLNEIVAAVRRALGPDMQLKQNGATVFGWLTASLGDGFYDWQEITFNSATATWNATEGGIDSTDVPTADEGRAFAMDLSDALSLSTSAYLLLPMQFKDGTNVWAIIAGGSGAGVPNPTLQGQVLQATSDNAFGWQFPVLHSA